MPPNNYPDRRRFLQWTCTSGAFFAAHGFGMAQQATDSADSPGSPGRADRNRIRRLRLVSAAPIAEMAAFYRDKLGLNVTASSPEECIVDAGQTRITFVKKAEPAKMPFYHFAFNIPENKIVAAHRWQSERTPLLPIPARLREARFPDEVVNYAHWNAHSIFFFDPSYNVVEYIARHDLANAAPGGFTSDDILYASEIAFVTDDVSATSEKLRQIAGTGNFRGASDQFAAVGDELGLLLVMKRGRVISFESPVTKAVDVFPTAATIRAEKPGEHSFADFPYEVVAEG